MMNIKLLQSELTLLLYEGTYITKVAVNYFFVFG